VADPFQLPKPRFASPESSSGARFGLDTAAFARWWNALPAEDQAEFTAIHGGDEVLARFVCAFDTLTTMQHKPQSNTVIVYAYMLAARIPDDELPQAQIRAAKAWQHDAVQFLLDRIRYRSARQATARITNAVTHLIEHEISRVMNPEYVGDDTENVTDQRAKVGALALSFLKIVQREDVAERAERSRRGAQLATAQLKAAQAEANEEAITEDSARLYLRMIQHKLGDDVFQKTVRHLESGDK
jgi:hypothetical protein